MRCTVVSIRTLISLPLVFSCIVLGSGSVAAKVKNEEDSGILQTQIGMYDLLAKKSEVYEVDFIPIKNDYNVSIVTQADHQFSFEGNLEIITDKNHIPRFLEFTPEYYFNPAPPKIIDSIADHTKSYDFIIQNLNITSKQLIATQSGLMILMDKIIIKK